MHCTCSDNTLRRGVPSELEIQTSWVRYYTQQFSCNLSNLLSLLKISRPKRLSRHRNRKGGFVPFGINSEGYEWVRSKVSKGRAIMLAKIATISAVNQKGNFWEGFCCRPLASTWPFVAGICVSDGSPEDFTILTPFCLACSATACSAALCLSKCFSTYSGNILRNTALKQYATNS